MYECWNANSKNLLKVVGNKNRRRQKPHNTILFSYLLSPFHITCWLTEPVLMNAATFIETAVTVSSMHEKSWMKSAYMISTFFQFTFLIICIAAARMKMNRVSLCGINIQRGQYIKMKIDDYWNLEIFNKFPTF